MRTYKKNIRLDYIFTFVKNFNLTSGIWVAYLGIIKGFSLTEVGILEGVFHMSSLTTEIPTGMFADIYGRKASRIVSILIYIAYIAIMLYSNNFYIIMIGLFFCGVSYTFESGSGEALVYDSLLEIKEEARYKKVLGYKEGIFSISSGLALLIGGYLATIKYDYDFYFMIIIMLLGLIPLLMMKETPNSNSKSTKSFSDRFKEHFIDSVKVVTKDKTLLFLIIAGAVLAAPVTTLFLYFQMYLPTLEYSMFLVGVFLASFSLFGAIGGFFAEEIEKRFQDKLVLYIIPLLMIVSIFLIQIEEIIFVPFILVGFLDSLFYVILGDYVNKLVPSNKRATILSFNSFSFSVIMIILFPLVGYIGDHYSLKMSFFVLGVIVIIFYIILLIVLKRSSEIKRINEGENDVSN
jgi:MFS family permease